LALPGQRTFAGAFSQAVDQACREREVDQRGLADAIARIQYRARAYGPDRDELIRRSGRSWESRISAWKSGQRLPGSEADLRAALRVIAPGTLASDWLDLWQQARRQRRERLSGPGRGQSAAAAAAAGPGLAEGHHWRVSAGETSPGASTPFLFTGRGTAISAITAWLNDPDGARVCVVTGDPGSGKSAVLSWFALQDDPGDRRRFRDRHDYPRLPEGAIAAAVHARGRDLTGIVQDIARQVGVTARDIESLAQALAERGRKIVVLLDAADEAEGAERQLVPKLVLPVVRGWASQPLRLLLGARQHIARRLPASVASVNLDDPRFVDDGDLRTYITRVLSGPQAHAPGWAADAKRLGRVAAAVARHAARSYLVAQLVAGAVVERGELPSPDQPFPHDVAEAMQYYLAALPLDQLEAEDLLGHWPSPADRGCRPACGRPWPAGSQDGRPMTPPVPSRIFSTARWLLSSRCPGHRDPRAPDQARPVTGSSTMPWMTMWPAPRRSSRAPRGRGDRGARPSRPACWPLSPSARTAPVTGRPPIRISGGISQRTRSGQVCLPNWWTTPCSCSAAIPA
jgi:hypothetical protein